MDAKRDIKGLNVGCGSDISDDCINLDVAALPGVDVVHDLDAFPWPFENNQFNRVKMINVLEHLPDTIRAMEELWRITCSGANIIIRVPYWNCWQSVSDPTHKKKFHQKTFDFFDPSKEDCAERNYYSKARFKIEDVYYWRPLIGKRGWVRMRNPLLKAIMSFLGTYFCNIIWVVEFELRTIKGQR